MATSRVVRAFLGTLIVIAVAISAAVVLAKAQRPVRDSHPGPPLARRSADVLVRHGIFPAEEWFVRDLYARLMRYEAAGRQFRAVAAGDRVNPSDALHVTLSEIKAGVGLPAALREQPTGAVIAMRREILCHKDDPCHVLYDLSWDVASNIAAPPSDAPARYAQYRVSLRLNGVARSYRAFVLFYDRPNGTTHAQAVDPYIPDLEEFAGERRPFARAPWHRYVNTRRYGAVIAEVTRRAADPVTTAGGARAGYVLGDRVTPDDEMMMAMSGVPCGGQAPTLTGPDSVVRGQNATFTVNAQAGAVISNWQFVASGGLGTINRTTGTGNSTWSGTLVSGGEVRVRVVEAGQTHDLVKTVAVTARPGWTTAALSPEKKSEGTTTPAGTPFTFPSPPQPLQRMGLAAWNLGGYFVNHVALNGGPNHGLRYVTALTLQGSRYFQWAMTSHLENTNSDFYRANCGQNGFIAASTLVSNITEHESGTTLGHYQQYRDANSAPATNLGAVAEGHVKAKSESEFNVEIQDLLNGVLTQVQTATGFEACNSVANRDTTCTNRGNINYLPYQPCGGGGEPLAVSFISHSVPTAMNAGQSYSASVTMRNTGTSTWTTAEGYKLGSQNPQDNQTWGLSRVPLPSSVGPGQEVTFSFTVTAPSSPGTYAFQWRMVREWVAWFGDYSPSVTVNVSGGGGGGGGMQPDSAIRGCWDWWWWNPVYQPTASACHSYCAQNNADACEWFVNGDCYVEFGSGCYVQSGFSGWSAAVFERPTQALAASVRPKATARPPRAASGTSSER